MQRRRNQKIKRKKIGKCINNLYLAKKERKTIRMSDFGLKLILNHPSSVDNKKNGVDG